jgi:hypothetical protein
LHARALETSTWPNVIAFMREHADALGLRGTVG